MKFADIKKGVSLVLSIGLVYSTLPVSISTALKPSFLSPISSIEEFNRAFTYPNFEKVSSKKVLPHDDLLIVFDWHDVFDETTWIQETMEFYMQVTGETDEAIIKQWATTVGGKFIEKIESVMETAKNKYNLPNMDFLNINLEKNEKVRLFSRVPDSGEQIDMMEMTVRELIDLINNEEIDGKKVNKRTLHHKYIELEKDDGTIVYLDVNEVGDIVDRKNSVFIENRDTREVIEKFLKIQTKYWKNSKSQPTKYARELLEWVKKNGYKFIILSGGTSRDELLRQIKETGLNKYVDSEGKKHILISPDHALALGRFKKDGSIVTKEEGIQSIMRQFPSGTAFINADNYLESGNLFEKKPNCIAVGVAEPAVFDQKRDELLQLKADFISRGLYGYRALVDDVIKEICPKPLPWGSREVAPFYGPAEQLSVIVPLERKKEFPLHLEVVYDMYGNGRIVCSHVSDDSDVFDELNGNISYSSISMEHIKDVSFDFLRYIQPLSKLIDKLSDANKEEIRRLNRLSNNDFEQQGNVDLANIIINDISNLIKDDINLKAIVGKDVKMLRLIICLLEGKHYFRDSGATMTWDHSQDYNVGPLNLGNVMFLSKINDVMRRQHKVVVVKGSGMGYIPASLLRSYENSIESLRIVDSNKHALSATEKNVSDKVNNDVDVQYYMGTGVSGVGNGKETDLIIADFCSPNPARKRSDVIKEIKDILLDSVVKKLNPNNPDTGIVLGVNSLLNIDNAAMKRLTKGLYDYVELGESDKIALSDDLARELDEANYNVAGTNSYSVKVYRLIPKSVKSSVQDVRIELEKKIFSETDDLVKFLKEFVDDDESNLSAQAFDYIANYGDKLLGRVRTAIGEKLLGLEEGGRQGYTLFQKEPNLSYEAYDYASDVTNNIKNNGGILMNYIRASEVYGNIAKTEDTGDKIHWEERGVALDVTNKAAGRILKNLDLGYQESGLFENMSFGRNQVLNDFFYAVIETRGLPGQFLLKELTHVPFEVFTGWISENYTELKKAFESDACFNRPMSDEEFRKTITDIIYVFNLVDMATAHPGTLGHTWNVEFLNLMDSFSKVIDPGTDLNWEDLYPVPKTIQERKDYLKKRLAEFRTDNSETNFIYNQIDQLPDEVYQDFDDNEENKNRIPFASFMNFQGGYIEPATSVFRASTQMKLIFLSIALAKKKGIDVNKHFNINFSNLKEMITDKKTGKVNPFKRSLIEGYLSDLSLEDILLGKLSQADWGKFDTDVGDNEELGALQLKISNESKRDAGDWMSVLDTYRGNEFVGTVMADFKFSKDAEDALNTVEENVFFDDDIRERVFNKLVAKYKLSTGGTEKNGTYKKIRKKVSIAEENHQMAVKDEEAFSKLQTDVCLDIAPKGVGMLVKYDDSRAVKRIIGHEMSAAEITQKLEAMTNKTKQWEFAVEDLFFLQKDVSDIVPDSILLRNDAFYADSDDLADNEEFLKVLKYCLGILPQGGRLLINFEVSEKRLRPDRMKLLLSIAARDLGVKVKTIFSPEESDVALIAFEKYSKANEPVDLKSRVVLPLKEQNALFRKSA